MVINLIARLFSLYYGNGNRQEETCTLGTTISTGEALFSCPDGKMNPAMVCLQGCSVWSCNSLISQSSPKWHPYFIPRLEQWAEVKGRGQCFHRTIDPQDDLWKKNSMVN